MDHQVSQAVFSGHEGLASLPERSIQISFLGEAQRLSLKPGDIVVVTCKDIISEEAAKRIHDHVRSAVGDDHKVLVLTGGLKLGVFGDN